MKPLQKLFLAGIVTIAICLSVAALAQSSLEAQRAAVVRLRIQRANGGVETAAGLYVGKDQQSAYFVTAAHAVEETPQGAQVRSIQIQFQVAPQNFEASVFEKYNAVLDLSVVRTAIAYLPPAMPQIVRKDVSVGIPVRIIGHPLNVTWSVWPGYVQNENGPNDEPYLFITNLDKSLVGGYSGGPVLDSDGHFVGMHTATNTSYGIAIKSADIFNQLIVWHIPTNNLTVQSSPIPPTSSQQTDLDAIKKVLDSYSDAYNRRDATALWRVWQSPPSNIRHAIEQSFSGARSITMRITPNEVKIEPGGAGATVTGQFSQVFTPTNGTPQTRNEPIIFVLKKNGGVWTIVDVQ